MNKRNQHYTKLAHKLVETLPGFEDIREVQFCCVVSDVEKTKNGKLVYADCTKVNKGRYDWCCPYDFFITIYEPNILDFNDEQIEILMKHELMHIGISNEGIEPSFYIVPHDVEEFWGIIEKHGIDWQQKKET